MLKQKLAKAGIHEKQLDANGVTINYAEGPASGPPLLLIPGQSIPWQSYVRVLPLLAQRFHVIAVDVRGHGKSSRTPGDYTIASMGRDLACLMQQKFGQPAIVSGNSSGGLIAIWLAAHYPALVQGVIAEDAPIFSSEYPRIKDCYVYEVFESSMRYLDRPNNRDLAGFMGSLKVPVEGKNKIFTFPTPLRILLSWFLKLYRWFKPDGPVDIPFLPRQVRLALRGFSEYDVEFSKNCMDGSAMQGFDHAQTLAQMQCPFLLLHANWFVHPTLGLVGAMDDSDLARVQAIKPDMHYSLIDAGHMIHLEAPQRFVEEVVGFAGSRA